MTVGMTDLNSSCSCLYDGLIQKIPANNERKLEWYPCGIGLLMRKLENMIKEGNYSLIVSFLYLIGVLYIQLLLYCYGKLLCF